MNNDGKTVELRMIAIVVVDVASPALLDILASPGKNQSTVAEIVSSEVESNLESVDYVEAAIVSQL